jgi:hypothetical protein
VKRLEVLARALLHGSTVASALSAAEILTLRLEEEIGLSLVHGPNASQLKR